MNDIPVSGRQVIDALYEPLSLFIKDTTDDEVWDHSPNFPNKWQKARAALKLCDAWREAQRHGSSGLLSGLAHAAGDVLGGVAVAVEDTVKGAASTVSDAAAGVADAAHKVAE